jgi:hypothetical protein
MRLKIAMEIDLQAEEDGWTARVVGKLGNLEVATAATAATADQAVAAMFEKVVNSVGRESMAQFELEPRPDAA